MRDPHSVGGIISDAVRVETATTPSEDRGWNNGLKENTMATDKRLPDVGAVLTRVYKGETLTVTRLADGFEFKGDTYKSLSKLAAKICEQKAVNGFAFFKLGESEVKKPRKAKIVADAAAPAVTPDPVA